MKIKGCCKDGGKVCEELVRPYELRQGVGVHRCNQCGVSGIPIAGMKDCPKAPWGGVWKKEPKQLKLGSLAPYRVEGSLDHKFCTKCKRGVIWEVLTPEGEYLSQSWEDKDEAEWMCDQLNTAYRLGEESMCDE